MFDDAPDWFEHPAYAESLTAGERLVELRSMAPAGRPADELGRLDAAGLSDAERVELVTLIAEQRNWLDALEARVLAEIDGADDSELGLAQEEVSLALKVAPRTAQNRLKTARTLCRDLPNTLALLDKGAISQRHAQVLVESSWRLADELLPELEAALLARAPEQTVPQLQRAARRAELRLAPTTAETRHQQAAADRSVRLLPLPDGMAQLSALLPAPEAELVFTRLTAATRLLPAEDERTIDQQRTDLLVDAVLAGLPHDALPELQGRRPSIQVIVAADTLLGLDEEPAELTGHGPITAETARRLAADQSGTWRRLLTDPNTGNLLDISPRGYRPAQRLRDFVTARDGVCVFPTCNQPGYRCEYEHTVPYAEGGGTDRGNGALACRRHNLTKNGTGWHYRRQPDGGYRWTTHSGHHHTGHPPERWTQPVQNALKKVG